MNSQFHFKGFEPQFELSYRASLVLSRILDVAPYGTTGLGALEKQDEKTYRCSLDLCSVRGPFMASAVSNTPERALEALEEKMKAKLSLWRSARNPCPSDTGDSADAGTKPMAHALAAS